MTGNGYGQVASEQFLLTDVTELPPGGVIRSRVWLTARTIGPGHPSCETERDKLTQTWFVADDSCSGQRCRRLAGQLSDVCVMPRWRSRLVGEAE